jgi:methylaspartate ammonia-lyase
MEVQLVILDFQQILTAARQLPKASQVTLVSALLQDQGSAHAPALEPVTDLSEAELSALAASVLAPAHALEDIQAFADAAAADYLQVRTPDLGGINKTIEALLYCREKGTGLYLGGSANETEQSARLCAHIALACRADFMMCKPGQGVDEGLLILTNEMQRTLILLRSRRASKSSIS